MENGITKKQSSVLQGIAIWMMVYHHLFLGAETYESLLPFVSVDAVRRIAWLCKICVGIFAFVSGYGMYYAVSGKSEKRFFGRLLEEYRLVLARILRLYGKLWLVILVFKGTGFLILGEPFVPRELWGNLTTFKITYNGTWWYAEQYAKMLLALPLLDLLLAGFEPSERKKKRIFFLTLAGAALAGFLAGPAYYEFVLTVIRAMRPSFFLTFLAGYFIARSGAYQRIDRALRRGGVRLHVCLSAAMVGAAAAVRILLATDAAWAELDFLLTPVLAYGVLALLSYGKRLGSFLAWWGEQSAYIWLVHLFFMEPAVSLVRRHALPDLLAYLMMMLVSAAAAVLLKRMEAGILKVWQKGTKSGT